MVHNKAYNKKDHNGSTAIEELIYYASFETWVVLYTFNSILVILGW